MERLVGRGLESAEVVEDIYGMGHGGTPKAHDVPKLEDLLASAHIVQNE